MSLSLVCFEPKKYFWFILASIKCEYMQVTQVEFKIDFHMNIYLRKKLSRNPIHLDLLSLNLTKQMYLVRFGLSKFLGL